MAGREHLGHTQQGTRGGRVRQRAVLLEAAHRLLIEVAADAAVTCLCTGTEARRREDRLLDVRLDHLVAQQLDVGLAGLTRQRVVEHDALDRVEERVPRRQHDGAADANAGLRDCEMRDAAVVDRVNQRLGGGRHDAHELVHRPHVELVPVARLAVHADHVRVGVAEEVRIAPGLTQVVVEQRVRAADQVRAAHGVHRSAHDDAEAVAVLVATGPEGVQRSGNAVALDGEVLGVECVGRMHEGDPRPNPSSRACPTSSYGSRDDGARTPSPSCRGRQAAGRVAIGPP